MFCLFEGRTRGERAPPAITDNNHRGKKASCSNNGRQLARALVREHLLICPALSKQKKKRHFAGKKAAIRYLFGVGKPHLIARFAAAAKRRHCRISGENWDGDAPRMRGEYKQQGHAAPGRMQGGLWAHDHVRVPRFSCVSARDCPAAKDEERTLIAFRLLQDFGTCLCFFTALPRRSQKATHRP